MPSFKIADCPTSLTTTPGEDKQFAAGKLSLTVRNTSARLQTARITIDSTDGADPSWFAIEGAPPTRPQWLECDFQPSTTQTISVSVKAPRQAEAKTYTFRVKATAEADPDNDFAESPVVSLAVPAAEVVTPPPPWPPLWMKVAAAAAVVLAVAVGVWLFWPGPKLPQGLVDSSPEAAKAALIGAGFAEEDISTETGPAVGHEPNTVAEVRPSGGGSRVTLVIDPGVVIAAPQGSPLEVALGKLIGDGLEPAVARIAAQDVQFFRVQTVRPPDGTTVASGSTVNITTYVPRTGGTQTRCPPFCIGVVVDPSKLPKEFTQPKLLDRNRLLNLGTLRDQSLATDPSRQP